MRPLLSILRGLGSANNLEPVDELAASGQLACFSRTNPEERYCVGVVVWCVLLSKVLSVTGKSHRTLPTIRWPIQHRGEKVWRSHIFQTLNIRTIIVQLRVCPTSVGHLMQEYFVQQ